MNRLRRHARWALPVLPALLPVGCSGSETDPGRPLAVGGIVDSGSSVEGLPAFVQLPSGRLDLTVSRPRRDLPAYDEAFDRAPDGGSLIGVGWSWDFASATPGMLDSSLPDPEPKVSLLADGRAYPLDEAVLRRLDDDPVGDSDSALDYSGGAWVAVDGVPEELQVQVEYDGVTQVVEPGDSGLHTEAGAATPLYRSAVFLAAQGVGCGDARVLGSRAFTLDAASCRATVSLLPYEQHVGWAPVDAPWVVVDVDVDGGSSVLWERDGQREVYSVEDTAEPFSSLDGTDPVEVVDPRPDDAGARAIFPGSSAGGTLVVDTSVSTSGIGVDDPAPRDPTLAVRWTIDLP